MANDTKNIFISHIHEDDAGLAKLKDLIKRHGMTPRDYSINADNPNNARDENYIKSRILAPRILQSSTLVVYISRETKDSPWVDWEIEYAHKHDKRIVGVWENGKKAAKYRTPWTGSQTPWWDGQATKSSTPSKVGSIPGRIRTAPLIP